MRRKCAYRAQLVQPKIPGREEGGSVPSTWEGIAPFQEASALASRSRSLQADRTASRRS